MGGCVSLDAGPADRGRDLRFHTRSPLPPSLPLSATVPEDEPAVVKQVLPETRSRRPLSPLPANDEKAYRHSLDHYSPVKVKPPPVGAPADHGKTGGNDPKATSSPSRLHSPPLGSTLRSASAREHPGDRSGMQQPEMMMMMAWGGGGGGQGMLGRRARSLRDPASGEGPLFLQEAEKPQKSAGPGKETLENPLVSLECFIFL